MTVEWLQANGKIPAATTESRASATAVGSGCGGPRTPPDMPFTDPAVHEA
jgi:hypothetical protein